MTDALQIEPEQTARRSVVIHIRLAAVMAACILPLWVATAVHAYNSYHSQRTLLIEHTLGTARALALVVDREFGNIQAALRALATSPAFAAGDFATAHRQALEVLKSFPESDLIVADQSAQQVVNSFLPFGTPLPKRGAREAVEHIFKEGTPRISNAFLGAVTKRLLVSLDVPIRVDERVLYDLAITIPANHLGRIVLEQHLSQGWIGCIIDGNGTVVATNGDAGHLVGKLAGEAFRKAVVGQKEGTFEEVNGAGLHVVSAFSGSTVSKWSTMVSVPLDLLENELRRWLWSAVVGAIFSSVAAIGLAVPIARRILQANRRLEESEIRFRSMADSSPAFIWLADREGRRFWFNRTWLDAAGRTLDEESGWGWTERIHSEDRESVLHTLSDCLAAQTPWRCEYRLTHKDNSIRWILDTGVARGGGSDGLGFVGSAIDISELKHTELELRKAKHETEELLHAVETASRSKTEFLAGLSHELRTPLNAINGFSELGRAQAFGPLSGKYAEYFENIHHSGQLLIQLVNELMDLSTIESGKVVLDEEVFDLGEALGGCANLLRARAEMARVTLQVNVPAGLYVRADKRRTKQIALNLLSNAVKFTLERGRAVLSAGRNPAGGAYFTIADTGIGMDAETIAKAMTPFGVAGRKRRPKTESVGLGLSVTKSLLELHGGHLEIVSRLGEGTAATAHFPPERVLATAAPGLTDGLVD